jgi:hypothetical protein
MAKHAEYGPEERLKHEEGDYPPCVNFHGKASSLVMQISW